MIVTMYRAAKIAEVPRQYVHRESKKNPRPGYFIDIPGAAEGTPPRVDSEHPDFKRYCQNEKFKRDMNPMHKSHSNDDEIMQIFDAVEKVIVSRYDENEAKVVKGLILGELEG